MFPNFLENYIKNDEIEEDMSKVLIATLYSHEPVMLSATKVGADRIILLEDVKPNEKQKSSLELVKKALKGVVDVKTLKTEVYDIVKIAESVVKAIDLLPDEDRVYVNITASRKTQALGLLFASYCRLKKIKEIMYIIEGENKIVYLPKLGFDLSNSEKTILEHIKEEGIKNLNDFSDKIKISKGMLYRSIKELQDKGLVFEDEGYKLTDAGRIAVL